MLQGVVPPPYAPPSGYYPGVPPPAYAGGPTQAAYPVSTIEYQIPFQEPSSFIIVKYVC